VLSSCYQIGNNVIDRYAYIEVALYGKPYVGAAKDTFRLFKDRGKQLNTSSFVQPITGLGIDVLVNDSLIGMTLLWGAYAVGMLCSLFGYIYLRCKHFPFMFSHILQSVIDTHPSYNSDGQYTAPVILFAFLIGIQCCTIYLLSYIHLLM
jgi:Plasma-membrane choline transporter